MVNDLDNDTQAQPPPDPGGIVRNLGDLPPDTLIDVSALARIFGICRVSIRRAIQRGELPPPAAVCGKRRWLVRAILDHIRDRQRKIVEDARRAAQRLTHYSPDTA